MDSRANGISRLMVIWVCCCVAVLCGCSGVGDDVPVDPTSAIVVVGVIDAETEDFLEVAATAVVGGVRETVTVAEGSAVLRNIPFGTGTPPTQPLTVTARGYVTESYPIQISVTTATFETVTMTPANLSNTGIVEGYVKNETTGDEIVSAMVSFEHTQPGGETVVVNGHTDNKGYYIIGGMPIGRVEVTVAAEGYLTTTTVINVAQAEGAAEPQQADFTLVGGETKIVLRGRVVDVFTQQPIAGAEVTVAEMEPVYSGANGAFSVPDVFVGEQTVVVKAQGYDDYRQNVVVLPGMGSLLIQMNEQADRPPAGPYTIRGTVSLVGAVNNAGARVEVFDVNDAFVAAETFTNIEGGYSVFVPPGTYEITVSYEGRSISRTVTLPGGGQKLEGIDFTLTVD
jgi:hypothetical protein